MKFDRDPQKLGFFLAQVLIYMQVYGQNFLTQGAQVPVNTLDLEGAAARWMVNLHSTNAPELRNFNQFMTALRHPLLNAKPETALES